MLDPKARPRLRIGAMLRVLEDFQIDWVLSGSMVLRVYGAALDPNDLDVVPSLDPRNLARLPDLMAAIDAVPAYVPEWEPGLSEEQCLAWKPQPATAEHFDHMFVTRLGMLDIVPRITGTYDELSATATTYPVAGVDVRVCDPDEVLRRLVGKDRLKDRERRAIYDGLRERLRHDRTPRGIPLIGD